MPNVGPEATRILKDYFRVADPGDHILINGDTKSGKTSLVPYVTMPRSAGYRVLMAMKPTPDATIVKNMSDWTRWKKWPKRPHALEKNILLWPDTSKMRPMEAVAHQREIFRDALEQMYVRPGWTIISDESYYLCHPSLLNLGSLWSVHNVQGRSMGNTCVTLTQRPSHLPLVVYGSCTHAFVGRTSEDADVKRLSQINARYGVKQLSALIPTLDRNDFLYLRKGGDDDTPPILNLAK